MVANSVEETVTGNRGDQLLSEERQKDAADSGKVEVVDLEQEVELEWLAATHQFTTAEDDDVVCDEEGRAGLEGREGCFAGHEAEILGLVANDGLESLLEDRPERDTEGAVQRRDAHLKPIETHCVVCWSNRGRTRFMYSAPEGCAEELLLETSRRVSRWWHLQPKERQRRV